MKPKIYAINPRYILSGVSFVDFPVGKEWADVDSWYVRNDAFYATFDDGTEYESILFTEADVDCIDWTLPERVSVMETYLEDGAPMIDWDVEIAGRDL